ncbi:MAG: insulinase family protein [Saccharospirillaceae bacterium]|nr:insulinase family protein [Pseudomonadales bacterium]NRB77804.1 insulinase family protein [Saccharospirillaceae bacterium]
MQQQLIIKIYILCMFCLFSVVVQAAVKVPHKQFKQFKLDNGMHVIFSEFNRSDNRVQIDWNIQAGSAQELNELQGTAHLLEHSLFSISEHKSLFDYFASIGGSIQAYTYLNGTSYRFTVKQEHIDDALNVISQWQKITQFNSEEHLKNQDIVVNEIQLKFSQYQSISPYKFEESPLTRKTVGIKRDINNTSLRHLEAYYQHWYHPQNTHLLISGMKYDKKILNKVENSLNKKWLSSPNFPIDNKLKFRSNVWNNLEQKFEYDAVFANYYFESNELNIDVDLTYIKVLKTYLNIYLNAVAKTSEYIHDYQSSFSIYPNYIIAFNASLYANESFADVSIKTFRTIINDITAGKIDEKILQQAITHLKANIKIKGDYRGYYEDYKYNQPFRSQRERLKKRGIILNNFDQAEFTSKVNKLFSEHYYGTIYSDKNRKYKNNVINIEHYLKAVKPELLKVVEPLTKNISMIKDVKTIGDPIITPIKSLKRAVYSWQLDNGIKVQFVLNEKIKKDKGKVTISYSVDTDYNNHTLSYWSAFRVWRLIKERLMNDILNVDNNNLTFIKESKYSINPHGFSADINSSSMNNLGDVFQQLINQTSLENEITLFKSKAWFNYIKTEVTQNNCRSNSKIIKSIYKKKIVQLNNCFKESDFKRLTSIDLEILTKKYFNRQANPTINIVGDLTLVEVKDWVETYITTLNTSDIKFTSAKQFIDKIKLPKSKTIEAGQHKGQDSLVTISIIDKQTMSLKNRQIQTMLSKILKRSVFQEIREEQALGYAVYVLNENKMENNVFNTISIQFSTSLNDVNIVEEITEDFLDEFLNRPIDVQYFKFAKTAVLDKILDSNRNKTISAYLDLVNQFEININEVFNIEKLTQSISLNEVELFKNKLKHNAAFLIFYQHRKMY